MKPRNQVAGTLRVVRRESRALHYILLYPSNSGCSRKTHNPPWVLSKKYDLLSFLAVQAWRDVGVELAGFSAEQDGGDGAGTFRPVSEFVFSECNDSSKCSNRTPGAVKNLQISFLTFLH